MTTGTQIGARENVPFLPILSLRLRCSRLIQIAFVFFMPSGLCAHAQTATPVRAVDAPCLRCHKTIVDEYLRTPMANASGLAFENAKTGDLKATKSTASYSIARKEDRVTLFFQQSAPPANGSRTLEYFLGSGHLGTTYLYTLDGYLLESPVAFYAGSGLDMKPGIPFDEQIAAALPVTSACLRCHMSAVQHTDPGTINHYQSVPFLHTGITCEACHGDTAAHLRTDGKAAVVNPLKLDERRRDAVCISCHLEGDVSVERQGRSVLDYHPGDLITDYLSYFVFSANDPVKRGVSEVEQLNVSVCKRSSGAKLSCTSCHDPHATPTPQQRVAFYRSKCLACHNEPAFAATHHPENPDCASCHMPKTGAKNIAHVAWTDHRILKHPDMLPLQTLQPGKDELTSILSPQATSRDLALAYYSASFNGRPALRANAYGLLDADASKNADPEALAAMGTLVATKGDFVRARELFERVLAIEPANFSAATNLATLAARSGDLKQAIALWQPAFLRNQDIPGLAQNLALAQCLQGDITASRTTLQSALSFSPGQRLLVHALEQLPKCR